MFFFGRTRLRRSAKEMLRHAAHVRRMREDIAAPKALNAMGEAETAARAALKSRDNKSLHDALEKLDDAVQQVMPPRRYTVVREYVEILAVAISVAMGFRAYFIQPFKIPTGSMQPTLYGFHYEAKDEPRWYDAPIVKPFNWFITGHWHQQVRAEASGYLSEARSPTGAAQQVYFISGHPHVLPGDKSLLLHAPGTYVEKGELLWRGDKIWGDHVFVDKLTWNFRRPRRSEVIVFVTPDTVRYHGSHYIKRLVGLPGERLTIRDPYLFIDGQRVTDHTVGEIGARRSGFTGYHPGGPGAAWIIMDGDRCSLSNAQYFACGDNTDSSYDSRYWGPVPQERLVGPAWIVYWPFGKHWGRVSR
jgi:signal peptidase I